MFQKMPLLMATSVLYNSEIENTKVSQVSLPYSRESTDFLFLLLPDTVQGLHLA